MAFYWTCPFCGANLDHGERCDCRDAYKIEKAAFASDQEAQMPRSVNAQKRVDTVIAPPQRVRALRPQKTHS